MLALALAALFSACSKPLATQLDLRAGQCGAADAAGTPITFANTTLTSDVDTSGIQLCEIAKGSRAVFEQYSRRALRTTCQQLLSELRSALHTDDFAAMAQTLKNNGAEESGDPKAQQLLHMVENCESPDTVEFDLNHLRIYSVGHVKAEGKVCLGYLLEVQDTQNDSRSYDLVGTGGCAGGDPSGAAIVEPGTGTDPPGNRMRDRWAYTGELPGKWVFRGQELAFVTAEQASAPAAVTPTVASTPAQASASVPDPVPTPRVAAVPQALEPTAASASSSPPESQPEAPHDGSLTKTVAAETQTVRDFYEALHRGDGAAANSLMSLEKRVVAAYQPDAIATFYGRMAEPLMLLSVAHTGPGDYEAHYRYRKQSAVCKGRAIVTMEESTGRPLIARIKPLGSC